MRKRPTIQTITFQCPRCGYKQRGYFNTCPTPDCERLFWATFVTEMKQRCAKSRT